jgi:2-hydroxyacyl-CoA lyase 1
MSGEQLSGYQVLARALAKQGIKYSFGIVGIPVIETASSLQAEGIQYYGFRNEQAASYAAGMIGYLTQRPGIGLAVSGPGMTNMISGMG